MELLTLERWSSEEINQIKGFNPIKYVIMVGNKMTMNCPLCGMLMVWLNGSITHDRPINYYQCRNDNINITKFEDGTYEIQYPKNNNKKFQNRYK